MQDQFHERIPGNVWEENIHTSSAQFRPENGKETLPNWFYEAITMTLKLDKIKM